MRTRWAHAVRRAMSVQEDVWDRYLTGCAVSGTEARSAVGGPPLRWSGRRLRGRVLPD